MMVVTEVRVEALMERLTTTEAAVAAGVSVPQIHRIIDEKILPEDLYSTSQMRTFRTEASVLIAFYFESKRPSNITC
jgi:gamma-glutamylcysteine synthetase